MTAITSKNGLFSKTATLLTGTFFVSALGTLLGSSITSTGLIIFLAVLFLVGAFAVPAAAQSSPTKGVIALGIWTFISGLFLGPAIAQYVVWLGWQTVFLAYLGTGGVMAACGMVVSLTKIDFSRLESILLPALLGLILVGLVNIFVSFGTVGTMLYAGIGMIVFAGFFLIDFFRLAEGGDSWSNAIMITMNLYLDYINFLLYLLRFLGALTGKSKD
jgi:FtsH-binding integral membrane protein